MLFLGKEDILKKRDGEVLEILVLIKSYEVTQAKGKTTQYLNGVLEAKGSIPFKVWSGDLFDDMVKYSYEDNVCYVTAKVNEFNGSKSLILQKVLLIKEGEYNKADFFESKYNAKAYWERFVSTVEKHCSSEGVSIFNTVFAGIEDRFKEEFAARSHHDCVKSGLLAHTYKGLYTLLSVCKLYPSITSSIDMDLLILGQCMHDVGKIYEYTYGVIKDNGLLVSHRTFGVELLAKYKEYIVGEKSEEFYYRLLAIIEQHHGEYEETPRTIEAYIIHLVDNIESQMQTINESLEKGLNPITINSFILR